jgi:hypothetical protein
MDKDKILEKIRALMLKTVENGASESEAVAAAQKVTELLEKYNLMMSEVEIDESECAQIAFTVGRGKAHPVSHLAGSIADLTGTKAVIMSYRNPHRKDMVFFGFEKDIEVAHYISELIYNAMESEFKAFKKTEVYKYSQGHGKSKRQSFMMGMVIRLIQRMYEMCERREQERAQRAQQATGTDLIVLKNQVVDEEFAKLTEQMNMKKTYHKPKIKAEHALHAGIAAGDKVQLNEGLKDESGSSQTISETS